MITKKYEITMIHSQCIIETDLSNWEKRLCSEFELLFYTALVIDRVTSISPVTLAKQ